jgi:hypothetical protein
MSIDRAVQLLSSNNEIENRNGCAVVINAAATAANLPEILNSNVINLLIMKATSSNEDLRMKFCWAINNICVHDQGREAVFRAGVIRCFPPILTSHDPETIKKASWALTNLSRHPQAQQQIVSSGSFAALINLLSSHNDEIQGAALQPLCNLVLDANNQLAFMNSGGLRPVVALLRSRDDKTKEMAVTLISYVTTNHDSVREALLGAGLLPPLSNIINGDGTARMQELAVNALVNLSLADAAEEAILRQGAVPPVVGLLSSAVPKLQQQSAMLLSNLLTNEAIRAEVRYLSWMDPLLNLLNADAQIVQQALRCIVNVTFDAHCRHMLVRSNAKVKIEASVSRVRDHTVSQLAETALKNFNVTVPENIKAEVENALASGSVKRVAAPTAQKSTAVDNAFAGLDELLGGSGASSRPAPQPSRSQPPRGGGGLDDLSDLLENVPSPTHYSAPKPQSRDPLDDLLDMSPPPQVKKSTTTTASASYHAPPPPSGGMDDLDALLGTFSPAKPAAQPSYGNDLDNLLSDFAPKPQDMYGGPSRGGGLADIDALLSDIGGSSTSRPSHSTASRGGFDDIDSLLADIGGPTTSHNTRASSAGFSAIDDILKGL